MDVAAQSTLTRDEMESRRLEAAQALLDGFSQSHVARKFGVSRTTASRWHRVLNGNGVEAMRKRRASGRPSRLTSGQQQQVVEIFAAGAKACGFDSERWTTARLAHAIEDSLGVRYDPDHVGRLMHRLGLRPPKPKRLIPAPPQVEAQTASMLPPYALSQYSPNTDLSRSEISPTVA